ncbi:MAG TPA: dolichyl-phosphate beta-glucosyltransferase [Candidatus Kryptonia bacterium]|nr:dolichyl-phosphate beta-glucosyltransferase [Candidatus Kryptonia bacterium]
MKISVVVPAYNEARRILPSLEQIFPYLDAHHPDYEVLVVDDGSTDETVALVRRHFGQRPQLRLVAYDKNRGKGFAVRYGAEQATGDLVLFTDADLSTPIQELDKLLPFAEQGYDLVMGTRAHPEADIRIRQPFYREYGGKLFNLLIRVLLLREFHDTQCGFKLFRRAVMLPILRRQRIDRFAFDVELVYLAHQAGLKIADVPVVWMNSPETKMGATGIARAVLDVLRIWLGSLVGQTRTDRPAA